MSHVQLFIDGAMVYDSAPQSAAGSSQAPVQEPAGDYSTVLEGGVSGAGGHGHKFRPGKTVFSVPGVQSGQSLEIGTVTQGDVLVTLLDGAGQPLQDFTGPGISTFNTKALPPGDYQLVVDAPNYGEINVWRH